MSDEFHNIQQIVSDPSPKVPPRRPNTFAVGNNCLQTHAHSHHVASSGNPLADRTAGIAYDAPHWETIRFAYAGCEGRYLCVVGRRETNDGFVASCLLFHAAAAVSVLLNQFN